MPTDIFSCTLADRRILSILSQTIGFLADADLDTEHLRWMGDARFVWGVICASMLGVAVPRSVCAYLWRSFLA
jgi:diacylglycerol kinase family enzyme